jgi:hypothetical protein
MASPCERCRRAVAPGAAFCAACGQPHHAGLLGALIDGRYQIEAFVGAGGMGRVYRAVHVALEREVAIKVLAPEVANRPELLERFRREAVATSRLAHPNVVGALDFGRHDGVPFFVMEWLDGDSLEALLTHGPMAPARGAHDRRPDRRCPGRGPCPQDRPPRRQARQRDPAARRDR